MDQRQNITLLPVTLKMSTTKYICHISHGSKQPSPCNPENEHDKIYVILAMDQSNPPPVTLKMSTTKYICHISHGSKQPSPCNPENEHDKIYMSY